MANSEKKLLNELQLYASKNNARLFRCNTGRGWIGKTTGPAQSCTTVTLNAGDVVIRKARPFHTGWPKGTSDLIGLTRVTITEELLGRTLAVFTAIEAKTPNVRATKEQKLFIQAIQTLGGISAIAKNIDHYKQATLNFMGDKNENNVD